MSATLWSKFFWSDWLSDKQLRRCSPAARALWMDMLCLAAEGDPIGYLAEGDDILDVEEIARMTGFKARQAGRLIDELERRRVLSRDEKGRIFSRRMVRDSGALLHARRNGAKGGNPNIINARSGDGVNPGVNPHKPEAGIHSPEVRQSGTQASRLLIERAAAALKTPIERLMRKPAWLVFGDMVGELAAQGCEAERDVWPTITRIASRMREPPASPAYFRQAILEARDARLARGPSRTAASCLEWEDRLAVFAAEGAWSSRWGPKPGEAGCVAPMSDDR